MILIVGLGNPGPKFKKTRHNLGFWVIEELKKEKRKGWILAKPRTSMNLSGVAVKKMIQKFGFPRLGKAHCSHTAASEASVRNRRFLKEGGRGKPFPIGPKKNRIYRANKIQNLVVIHDDIDIPIGEFKIQKNRGSGGHKGIQSIIDELGTKDFWRVRIGIQPKFGKPKNVEKFVLQNFTKIEEKIIKETIKKVIHRIAKTFRS